MTERAHGRRRAAGSLVTQMLIAGGLTIFVGRLIVSGIVEEPGLPINVSENFGPLFGLLVEGRPIDSLGPRQYGAVAFLLFDPIIRVVGRNDALIGLWSLLLGLASLAAAFALTVKRFAFRGRDLALLAMLWAGFLPIVLAVGLRHFDMFVLGFLATGLFLYTGSARQRPWSGSMVGAAFLTKLLPVMLLPVLLVREPRAFLYGVLTIFGSLSIGQVLYGTLMGFGYLPYLATSSLDAAGVFSLHSENNSLRGLIFKMASGFHLGAEPHLAPPANAAVLNAVSTALAVAIFGYLMFVITRYRQRDDRVRRSVEFALALVTMYVIAPQTSHEHMASMVLVFTVLAWLRADYSSTMTPTLTALACLSLFLIGVYLPMSLVATALGLGPLMLGLGNDPAILSGSPVGAYNFLGFAGYGLIIAWIVMAVVERRTRSLHTARGKPSPQHSEA